MSTGDHPENKRPPRFLLAMPDHVRAALEKEAFIHSRTLTAEINVRLAESLQTNRTGETGRAYVTRQTSSDSQPQAVVLSGDEDAMLEVFRALPPEKRLALLSLFR